MKDDIKVWIDKENPSIQRINEKCINCGLCLKTCNDIIGIDKTKEKDVPLCINCGMCILNCPMGALKEKYDYKKVLNLINDTDEIVTISLAPAVRVALGEELKRELGTSLEGVLPAILKKLGFDYVFDVTFGADVTIMEEASELIDRIRNGKTLPMFTSCCPAWVKYAKMFHPELTSHLSTTKSPISIMSSLIKTYFKEMNGITKDIVSIVVAPCTAKKYEASLQDTDYVITTRELALMIRECEIDIDSLKPQSFDSLLGRGSKKGLQFGRSGGVMEAALSTVHYLLLGENPKEDTYSIKQVGPISEASYKIGDRIIDVCVVSGMKNLEKVLPVKEKYDFIEVMNCPGGCIGGGGQPLASKQEVDMRIEKRKEAIIMDKYPIDFCHDNKEIKELYRSYLLHPLSEKAETLLHQKHENM